VTQLRGAVRKLLRLLGGGELAKKVRSALNRDEDYASPGKPPCDWDDPAARVALVDELVRDAKAALSALEGEELEGAVAEAYELLAVVAGQDVEQGEDGKFEIAGKGPRDRVISTVDTEACHGHKSHDRQFDGLKLHASVDPGSELIDAVAETPANVPDREAVDDLLEPVSGMDDKPEVFANSAYADGPTLEHLEGQGFEVVARVPPAPPGGARERLLLQGRFRHRPGCRHGHLPRRPDGERPLQRRGRGHGQFRQALRDLAPPAPW
jgi:hypothetical protein